MLSLSVTAEQGFEDLESNEARPCSLSVTAEQGFEGPICFYSGHMEKSRGVNG